MEIKIICRNLKWLCVSILLVLLDFGTKYWIKNHLIFGEIKCILPGIDFYYINNYGLIFGLFSGFGLYYFWPYIWISSIIIMIFIIILCALTKRSNYFYMSFAMIIGGSIGNMLDRILYGAVTDFIDIHFGILHWPIFNIADVSVTIGVIIFLIQNRYSRL